MGNMFFAVWLVIGDVTNVFAACFLVWLHRVYSHHIQDTFTSVISWRHLVHRNIRCKLSIYYHMTQWWAQHFYYFPVPHVSFMRAVWHSTVVFLQERLRREREQEEQRLQAVAAAEETARQTAILQQEHAQIRGPESPKQVHGFPFVKCQKQNNWIIAAN